MLFKIEMDIDSEFRTRGLES